MYDRVDTTRIAVMPEKLPTLQGASIENCVFWCFARWNCIFCAQNVVSIVKRGSNSHFHSQKTSIYRFFKFLFFRILHQNEVIVES